MVCTECDQVPATFPCACGGRDTREAFVMPEPAAVRTFTSGATRNDAGDKFDYEGFLHPGVLHAYGDYMHSHRRQRDGQLRDSDNWQKGIPFSAYMKSLVRHVFDLWSIHRGGCPMNPDTNEPHTKEDLCCAILFNTMGYLKEVLQPSEINR